MHPHLTVFVKEIDSVDAVPALEAGELDLAFVRIEGKSAAISPRSHSQRTGLPLPCTRITHWRPSLAYA